MGWRGWQGFDPASVGVASAYDETTIKALAPKANKYGAQKTLTSDQILCDSKKEAARWEMLRMLEKAGTITDLLPHPSFPLWTNGKRTGRLTADSLYVERGRLIVEDVKSAITRKNTAYRQRVRQFEACYPLIEFREWLS